MYLQVILLEQKALGEASFSFVIPTLMIRHHKDRKKETLGIWPFIIKYCPYVCCMKVVCVVFVTLSVLLSWSITVGNEIRSQLGFTWLNKGSSSA